VGFEGDRGTGGRGGCGVSVKIYIEVQVCLCLPKIKYLGPEYKIYGPIVRGGQANPQTLGLIPLLLIRKLLKLLKGASPQIRKFSLLIRKLQISKFLKSTAKHRVKKVSCHLNRFFYFVIILIGQYMLYLSGAKACICGLAEVLVPRKRFGSQIANPQNTIPQMTKINWVCKLKFRKSATFAEGLKI
jgi:hypothetical protein